MKMRAAVMLVTVLACVASTDFAAAQLRLRTLGRGVGTSGSSGGGDEGPHDYYNEAINSPYILRQRSLRSQEEINAIQHNNFGHTTYVYGSDTFTDPNDGTQIDGAKIVLPENVANYEQLRTGINCGAEFLGAAQVTCLVVWDFYWDQSYQDNKGGLEGYKSFQLSRHNAKIYFESRNRFEANAALAGGLSYFDVRGYSPVTFNSDHSKGGAEDRVGPTTGINYGGDTIGPFENEFLIKANKWTRFFVKWSISAGNTFTDDVSVWVADEDRDPVQILQGIQMFWPANDNESAGGLLHQWWLEFNSSQSRPASAIIMFARNWFVLRDPPDVSYWLRRPVRNE